MSVLSISATANPNYLAKVIKLNNLRPLENSDFLSVTTIDGNNVITQRTAELGGIYVYFPLECQISKHYLHITNSYRTKEFNLDPEEKAGFFEDKGRVRAVKLRGNKSEGYIAPIDTFSYMGEKTIETLKNAVGIEFDTINGELLVKKYVVKENKQQGEPKDKAKKATRESILVDNQFRLHYDTAQLGKNLHRLNPDSVISVTWKMHGTSFVSSRVKRKKKLKWYEKALKRLGANIVSEEYGPVYASRKVVKNEFENRQAQHYYGYDLWEEINKVFEANLLDGESVYGEAVGYLKDGGFIQKGFDYGCNPGEFKVYVYRITHTNDAGKVIDLPFNMVKERCEQLGVEAVPEIFFGKAASFRPMKMDMRSVEEWRDYFLDYVKREYVYDQDSQFCKLKVPEEGIVIRVEGLKPEAFKLKAFRFLENETKSLDKGETNIEDEQTSEE